MNLLKIKRDVESTRIAQIDSQEPVAPESLPQFYRIIATCLNSGLHIYEALEIVEKQTEDLVLKKCTGEILDKLRGGNKISQVIPFYPNIFSSVEKHLIRIGEESGTLHLVLHKLADIAEENYRARRRFQSIVMRPAFDLTVILLASIFFPLFFLPKIRGFIESFSVEIPSFSRVVFGMTSPYFLVPAAAVAIVCWKVLCHQFSPEQMRNGLVNLCFRIPVLSRLLRSHVEGQWSRILSLQLEAGQDLVNAIEHSKRVVIDPRFYKIGRSIVDDLKSGASFTEAIKATEYFSPMVVQFAEAGSESGKLSEMFECLARMCEEEFKTGLETMESLLTPFFTLFCGGIAAIWIIALVLPMGRIVEQLM